MSVISERSNFEIVPPIILDENGDVQAYPSVSAVIRHLEVVDVLNNEYTFHDSTGRVLEAKVHKGKASLVPTPKQKQNSWHIDGGQDPPKSGGAQNAISPRKPFIPPAPFLKPHPIFKTRRQASAAAARADQSGQKKTGGEYGSLVFRVGSAGYTYTDPVTQGKRTTVDPFNTTGVPQAKPVDYSLAPVPLGMPLAAETHSHPDMNGFSGEDVERAHLLTTQGLHYPEFGGEYVGQPNGNVLEYDPHTGTQTVFGPGEPK
jgi:hypothetical protein